MTAATNPLSQTKPLETPAVALPPVNASTPYTWWNGRKFLSLAQQGAPYLLVLVSVKLHEIGMVAFMFVAATCFTLLSIIEAITENTKREEWTPRIRKFVELEPTARSLLDFSYAHSGGMMVTELLVEGFALPRILSAAFGFLFYKGLDGMLTAGSEARLQAKSQQDLQQAQTE